MVHFLRRSKIATTAAPMATGTMGKGLTALVDAPLAAPPGRRPPPAVKRPVRNAV